jgi:hypothetical protein
MPIYGVTHKTDGTAILRRSVMTKIAIGLPPKDKNDRPKHLDHFIFQKKAQRGSGMSAEVVLGDRRGEDRALGPKLGGGNHPLRQQPGRRLAH